MTGLLALIGFSLGWEVSDSGLRSIALTSAGIVATLLGLYGIFLQFAFNYVTDVEANTVTSIASDADTIYRLVITADNEYQSWAGNLGSEKNKRLFQGAIFELFNVKTMADVPDFVLWHKKMQHTFAAILTIQKTMAELSERLINGRVSLAEADLVMKRLSWHFQTQIGLLIDRIYWNIQAVAWARYRSAKRPTRMVLVTALMSVPLILGVALLTTISSSRPMLADGTNLFIGAVVWSIVVTLIVLVTESADALLVGRDDYIESVVRSEKLSGSGAESILSSLLDVIRSPEGSNVEPAADRYEPTAEV